VLSGCVAVAVAAVMAGCTRSEPTVVAPRDAVVDAVRGADLRARAPAVALAHSGLLPERSPQPLLFPGVDGAPVPAPAPDRGGSARWAVADQGASIKNGGVEINFEGADIRTVAKSLLGDTLGLTFMVDQRVQGNVTLASAGPIARKDVLAVFESALRMSNAAMVRDGDLVQIVPLPEASGDGAVAIGAGQPGFGVSIVPLHYASAATLAKTAENFLTRPGAVRADEARNLLLIQGTAADRQAALDVIAAFDVEWLRNQSVGIYPLKSSSPETMVRELQQVFEAGEGGQSQGVIKFQPVSRMNAVMVVTRNPKYLERATQWVERLDRSDKTGTTVRIYQLKHGQAPRIAKILNEIFGGGRSAALDVPANQIAPVGGHGRPDTLGTAGVISASAANAGASPGVTAASAPVKRTGFENFTERWSGDGEPVAGLALSAAAGADSPRGVFQNVRISANAADNSIVVYSNQEDYGVIERAMRELDRPQLQVAIEAIVAEVTLTDALQYGVQYFLSSNSDRGSVGLFNSSAANSQAAAQATVQSAVQTAVQSAFLQRVLPGFNLLLGPEAQPRVILSALSSLTAIKVLSAPSVVVMDSQPALLQVGDEVPISTGTATVLSGAGTPVVNTIEMRNTGVILKVVPHVTADGTIQLEIEQEISNVVNQTTQTLTPTISQRKIHSTVAVVSGQTVLLGGLISEREDKSSSGLPGLQHIAILGDLLGSKSNTRQRSEIVVFIKPQLIRNGVDARNVAEEFRERLTSIRQGGPIVKGPNGSAPSRR
jgi:general secretion pathway protein D